ncbi:MAG: type II toxin-antitoxin system PemK/MazF family toxin [Tenuifilaceae bacterium]|jgi:mRNA interferase MazF|nr:type II toxin-antitoxin system PemK/MazF family toxin [Tenuifilaceae bacterium]
MKFGQIVLVPFPFAEHTHRKVRPAVVITETTDKYKDLVVSAISSVVPSNLSDREIFIESSPNNRLRVNSIVKVDRIITLKRDDIIAQLGLLSDNECELFRATLMEMIG